MGHLIAGIIVGILIAVGAVIFAATVYNLIRIPHPVWFVAVALLGIPIASWLGAWSAARRALPTVTP